MLISGCSTVPGLSAADIPKVDMKDLCPPPQAFASWHDFTQRTQVKKGESAFTTVQRYRLAEAKKNLAGQRLWSGLKQCRAKKADPEPPKKPRPADSVADILSGGF